MPEIDWTGLPDQGAEPIPEPIKTSEIDWEGLPDKEEPKPIPEGMPVIREAPDLPLLQRTWDAVVNRFRDPKKESAKAVLALVDGERFGITPDAAYRLRGQIDDGVTKFPRANMKRTTAWERVNKRWERGMALNEANKAYGEWLRTNDDNWLTKGDSVQVPSEEDVPLAELGITEEAVGAAAELMPMMLQVTEESGWKGVTLGSGFAAIAAFAGQPELIPVAAQAGLTVGMTWGAMETSMMLEGGAAVSELRRIKDKDGKPLDRTLIRGAAWGIGTLNSIFEVAGLKALVKTIPGGDKIFKEAVYKTIKSKALKDRLIYLAKEFGTVEATEVSVELAQESTNIVMEELAKYVSESVEGTEFETDAMAIVDRLIQTGTEAAKGFAALALPGIALKTITATPEAIESFEGSLSPDVKPTYEAEKARALAKGQDETQATETALKSVIESPEMQEKIEEIRKAIPEEAIPSLEQVFERITQQDLTEEEIGQMLDVFAEGREIIAEAEVEPVSAIKERLLAVGMSEQEASSNAALYDGFRVLAQRAGVPLEDVMARYLPEISREMVTPEITDADRAAVAANPVLSERITTVEQIGDIEELQTIRNDINEDLTARREEMSEEEITQAEEAIDFLDSKISGPVIPAEQVGEMLEQPAYHGTPHKFDKFTLDHIGTGEGAQAYGWGLYFAESKDVAQWYREKLSADDMQTPPLLIWEGKEYRKEGDRPSPEYRALSLIHWNQGRNISQIRKETAGWVDEAKRGEPWAVAEGVGYLQRVNEIVNQVKNRQAVKAKKDKKAGQLLKVELAPKADEWLDWDKPLSEQSEKVQAAVNKALEKEYPSYAKLIKSLEGVTEAAEQRRIVKNAGFNIFDYGTAGMMYESLASALGSAKKASMALRAAGIPGIKYLDAVSRGKERGTSNYVLFDDELVTIEEYLQTTQEGLIPEAPRGRIRIAPEGINIDLLANADQSTFVHETGHLYLRMLSDLSAIETATDGLKTDFDTIRDWLGVKEGEDISREQNEQFARGFEAYLREGKAPSDALRQAFENFKQWLMQIYRSLRDLDVQLTDEVRGVMDRMLAGEDVAPEAVLPEAGRVEALEQAPIKKAFKDETDATFNPREVTTEPVPQEILANPKQAVKKLLPSHSEGGKYYHMTAEELQSYLETHGDGFLYRVGDRRAVEGGFERGDVNYLHSFPVGGKKTLALVTNFDIAKDYLDSSPNKKYNILYRVMPQDLADDFVIHIPSNEEARAKGDLIIHSPKPASTSMARVLFAAGNYIEEGSDVSRRAIEERRTAKEQGPEAEPVRIREGITETLEQAAPKEIKNIRQLAKKLGGIDYNREQQKGELRKLIESAPATRYLINKKNQGVTLDRLLEAAIERGILSETSTLDDVVTALEVNQQTPEAIEEEVAKEERAERRIAEKAEKIEDLRAAFINAAKQARKAYKEGKEFGTVKEARKLKNILARTRKLRLVRDYFNLTDADLKKISRKNPLLLSQYEFKLYLDDVRIKAAQLSEEKLEKAILIKTIHDKDLGRVDNYRRVLGLPPISKMTTEQARQFTEALEPFHEGDVFLSERELETVDRTDLEGIKTWREAKERLAKEIGVTMEELETIRVKEWDEYKWDTALAEANPFYKMLVTETTRKLLEADFRFHEIQNEVYDLAKKSEKSRGRTLIEKAIPQDKQVMEYLETPIEERDALIEDMTPEQIDFANYMEQYFSKALEYLIKTKSLSRGRENYFVHMRRSFLENVKEEGLVGAFKDLFRTYQEDEAVFNIMDEDTGNILPLEKFFQFSLRRTGGIDPTTNVTKAFLVYAQMMEKKISLDELIPKMDIYAQSVTPEIYTPRGLEIDRSIKKFVNKYINNKKGRRIRWIAKQGGTIDVSIRGLRTFTTLIDLGFNIPSGIAAFTGEQVTNFTMLGVKGYTKGLARMKTKKGKAILKKYEAFVGRSAWEEFKAPGKQVTERITDGLFGLFHEASVRSNAQFLLGAISDKEYNSGELSTERLAQLRLEMGRLRVVPGTKSMVGSTSAGGALMQYKTWAAPIIRTVSKDITTLLSDLAKKKPGEALSSREAREIYRLIGITTTAIIVGATALGEEDDDTFIGQILKRVYRESMTLLQGVDPSMWLGTPRLIGFFKQLGDNLKAIVTLEQYKTKPGLKGVYGLQQQLTPRAIKQFIPKEEKRERLK